MSSRRNKMNKKSVIKKRYFTKLNNLPIKKNIILFISSLNYSSIINYLFDRLLYLFLMFLVFPIISVFMWLVLLRGDLHFINIISVFFTFVLNLMVFAKILSLRTNWGLFVKFPQPLSWKHILLREKSFGVNSTFWISYGIFYVIYDDIWRVVNHPQSWTNTMIENYKLILIIITVIFIIIMFEGFFLMFVLLEKAVYYLLFKNTGQVKNVNFERVRKKYFIASSASFNATNSIIVLGLVLIISIIFAKIVSDQIDNCFLNQTSFNPFGFLISLGFAFLFLSYFITSLNKIIFKQFKWEYNIDIKKSIPILLVCLFTFINVIYFTKYLAVAMVYYPIDANDPATTMLLKTLSPAGKPWLEDKFFVTLITLMDYLTFSIISVMLVYLIFFAQTSKKHIVEFLEKSRNLLNDNNESSLKSKVIEKLFSKQLKNQKLAKYYSFFFYIYSLSIPFLASWIIMYLLFSDVKNGTGKFDIAVHKYEYEILAYGFLMLPFTIILGQVQKYYRYSLTYFISKDIWVKFAKYSTIHYSIVGGCLIDLFIRGVYRLSKEYGNIEPPSNIQTFQDFLISIFVLGFLFSGISSKVEEFIIKAYDYDVNNNSKKSKN